MSPYHQLSVQLTALSDQSKTSYQGEGLLPSIPGLFHVQTSAIFSPFLVIILL